MPMPNRHIQDANGYRYAYQGQEKDPETGKEAFELRLWDGRIGRWLTTDPYGEFHSPYLGMGNNPISLTDPDGGSTEGPDDWIKVNGFIGYIESIHNQADFNAFVKANGLEGAEYLGKTHTEGNDYFGLFGGTFDLGTFDGRFNKSMDSAVMMSMQDIINPQYDVDSNFQGRSQKFDLMPFKSGEYANNRYDVEYEGFTGHYASMINARTGYFTHDKTLYSASDGGFGKGGTTIYVYSDFINNFGQGYKIINLTAPDNRTLNNFIYKLYAEYNMLPPGYTKIKL